MNFTIHLSPLSVVRSGDYYLFETDSEEEEEEEEKKEEEPPKKSAFMVSSWTDSPLLLCQNMLLLDRDEM